ncbi:hypothetical protein A3B18_02635 [Candidatus Giovannonibacteria bacterium RIFCSPLOWO2_01_FULL_46_13]|uniref:Uncharacterized protein n=1 Tax=Candidatus Giovannonibacteria bacterium RIFCSPLOWO2_01_FULL_46_13 TaxID=1798352 RepID=A0A1F5X5A6_9BACT|nr:MAG: hypothetical protein A3B18_02635 [Candidatus Giovannonibacteria bacterium RIFCSPLOWO2_01_FULL_46_13]
MDFLSNKFFIYSLVIGLILLGGFYVWFDLKYSANVPQMANNTASTTEENGNGAEISLIPNRPVPDLPWPVEIHAEVSEEAKKMLLENIEILTMSLRKDPQQYSYWMDLALFRKQAGDFNGARIAWEYASEMRPDDFIPRHNLGDLYTYDIVNLTKAEEYYKEAIKRQPTEIMVYQKLYEMYRFKMKNDAKARAILEEGIAKNPQDSLRLEVILDDWINGR